MIQRQSRQHGAASRRSILARAIEMTAASGPQAATIGALATRLGMSKSGVFAHFGSKEALDVAVIEASAERFAQAVQAPAESAPPGVARLAALVEGWLGEIQVASPALAVLLPDRPGAPPAARERRRQWRLDWRAALTAEIAGARQSGELGPTTDAALATFEIEALLMAAANAIDGPPAAITAARRAIENRLQLLAAE